ncbi:MAG: hypothetical protein OXG69_13425 [bacterium]|nr:hypothetical protein [bacterium]
MLHQRIHAGGWLGRRGIDPLADIKSSPEPEQGFGDSWNSIARQDFLPVIEPATLALTAARRTGAFPILDSKGVDVQQTIEGAPDEHWVWEGNGPAPILSKAGHLFLTTGQWMPATRLTALATTEAHVGRGWRPVTGATLRQAQALAVFVNSTVGRMVLMRLGGRFLHFPNYNTAAVNALPIPNISDRACTEPLADCWEATRGEVVPQFRDGYTEVRRRWDAAVCDALAWDIDEITRLGEMLAREPRVRGVAYGQWKA